MDNIKENIDKFINDKLFNLEEIVIGNIRSFINSDGVCVICSYISTNYTHIELNTYVQLDKLNLINYNDYLQRILRKHYNYQFEMYDTYFIRYQKDIPHINSIHDYQKVENKYYYERENK